MEIKDPNPPKQELENAIIGETFVYPLAENIFSVKHEINGANWMITLTNENKDIDDVLEYEILEDNSLKLTWTAMISGSFEINYGDLTKTIIV